MLPACVLYALSKSITDKHICFKGMPPLETFKQAEQTFPGKRSFDAESAGNELIA